MRIYLAYKYTNIEDKDQLVVELKDIISKLETQDNTCFCLLRDEYNWQYKEDSKHLSLVRMLKEMIKCDQVLFYYNSQIWSTGLSIEYILSAIMLKSRSVIFKEDYQNKSFFKLMKISSL